VSTAKIDKLVRMANQIGDFFGPMGEEAATQGVANHLKRFWTPKMISEIIGYLDSGQSGLNPAAARAVVALKQEAEAEAEAEGNC
jgi:formate dehydrogenase subunit delta